MITFGKFPYAPPGENCNGAAILKDGIDAGTISRTFAYKDVGTVSARYVNIVDGYEVCLWATDAYDRVYPTLALARQAVREALSLYSPLPRKTSP